MKNKNHTGFTLIEVLLSLFLAAIIITVLSIIFNTGLRSYRQGKDLLDITRSAQLILGQMTRDLVGAMVGPNIIFKGEPNAVYFMAPIADDDKLDLCEVGYIFEGNDKEILRHYHTYWNETENRRNPDFEYPELEVDFGGDPRGKRSVLCDNVIGFDLQYRGDTGWDPSWTDNSKLPQMVEVRVTIQGEYPKNAPQQKKTFTTWIYLPNSTNNP